ncbi:MAG TPA: hypothetical protein VK548_24135 [Candidatus Acidoferrum sp.]|nr:hypothetical protein [Candidatus Acidoferrum sp.]
MPPTTPYITRNPGDVWTVEDFHDIQIKTKEDIQAQVQKAVGEIKRVERAGDAEKLDGKTVDALTKEILEAALKAIPARTGYRMLFKRLKLGEERVIKHGLKACPLVDVYQLDYFRVVCADDDHDRHWAWVNFYLYHTSEKRIRLAGPPVATIEIESIDSQPFKIPFWDLLKQYNVEYTDDSSLDDLVTEFWTALFAAPNDAFEPEQYCLSPWFTKCCGEKRTVGEMRKHGDFDDLWFQMRSRKTINLDLTGMTPTGEATVLLPAPQQIQVVHFDFDTLGVKLLARVRHPFETLDPRETKVMLLLKV